MTNKWCDFEYFGWDEDPIGKYTQPKQNPRFTKGSGYPEDDVDREGIKVYGRYVEGRGGKKQRMDIRGHGAAERGTKFFNDELDRSPPVTSGRIPVTLKK
jgi:hypothetical protein